MRYARRLVVDDGRLLQACVSMSPPIFLREQAVTIWQAGVAAVNSERLVANVVRRDGQFLIIAGHPIDVRKLHRLVVVGAGKAGAGMATAMEEAVGDDIRDAKLTGWVNVPANCVRPLRRIHLHAARPAGVNEPTSEGVAGSRRILDFVSQLGPADVCVVLLSGGGSALLPAPADGITLQGKQAVTRVLMHAGATIQELNTVRKQLSRIKGGRLARASRAGLTIALIISDVIGDPPEIIASGPTVPDVSTPTDALKILHRLTVDKDDIPANVWRFLQQHARTEAKPASFPKMVKTVVIGNNALALEAASTMAKQLGYHGHSLGSNNAGEARQVGIELAKLGVAIRDHAHTIPKPACVLSGGEPVVHVVPSTQPRKGGRNQELVLAGMQHLWEDGMTDIALLSGGTDGEDGPTDAAGALADAAILSQAKSRGLHPDEFLAINDSYHFFEPLNGLLITGPTHTNVMDLRVLLIR